MPRVKNLNHYHFRNWLIVVNRSEREIILMNPRNKIFTITRTTKMLMLSILPERIIEHLILANLIPNYLKVV